MVIIGGVLYNWRHHWTRACQWNTQYTNDWNIWVQSAFSSEGWHWRNGTVIAPGTHRCIVVVVVVSLRAGAVGKRCVLIRMTKSKRPQSTIKYKACNFADEREGMRVEHWIYEVRRWPWRMWRGADERWNNTWIEHSSRVTAETEVNGTSNGSTDWTEAGSLRWDIFSPLRRKWRLVISSVDGIVNQVSAN